MKHLYYFSVALLVLMVSANQAHSQAITHSILEIQGELFSSPVVGQSVTTTGIISANNVTSATSGVIGYFIQDGSGPWNGIFVFDNTQAPNLGDEVILEAEVQEYYDVTELGNISYFEVVSSGNEIPAASVVSTGELASSEAYEGCLVQIINATCTNPDADYGEALFNDGTGEVKTNDYMYLPEDGWIMDEVYAVTGCIHYTFEEYKLEPRSADDIVAGVGVDELSVQKMRCYPNPTQDTFRLGTEALGDLTITDMMGRTVARQHIVNPFATVNVQDLSMGMYQVILTSEGVRFQATLQKQ